MPNKNIPKVMSILEKAYPSSSNTTLNRMRQKPDPYKVLIACLLSLRARDENTEKISAKLFGVANTPQAMIKIPDKKLKKLIFSSGHFNKKAAAIKHVSK
ncbi:MAG: endonuclease III, partial [Nanoarchaeota archaeon]|nr:endonuclease III [Nanoarchaeota archaeon]